MADPTLATLEALKDPSKWSVLRGVPCFDAHEEYGDDGKLVRKFDRSDLQEIATSCNLREEATGTPGTIGPGHTLKRQYDKDGNAIEPKETDQPPKWGFARNWRVGTFGPQNKDAILCDWYVAKDKYADALSYPHRSIELWFKDKFIDHVALLRRTPQRDLGVLSDYVPPVGETDVLPRYLDPAKASGVRAYERVGEVLYYAFPPGGAGGSADQPPAAQPPGGQPPQAPADPDAIVQKCMQAFLSHPLMQHLAKEFGEKAGLTNDQYATPPVPAPDAKAKPGEKPMSEPKKDDKPDQNARRDEADLLRYAKLERENEDLRKQVGELSKGLDAVRGDYQRKDREGQLLQLQREGYVLDVAGELKESVEELKESDDAFGRRLKRIALHYRKDPTGDFLRVYDGLVEGGVAEQGLSQKEMETALQYQREHEGCTWEAAMDHIKKGKKTA